VGSHRNTIPGFYGEEVVQALYEVSLVTMMTLSYLDDRCINVCYTVLEEQTTDVVTKVITTPAKPANQKTQKSVKKEIARTPKHNHGNFTNNIHYMKLLWVMKNVYTVYQVISCDPM